MAQALALAGQTLKNPVEFSIENYALTRETGRLINGEIVMDHVALKKKFIFSYAAIGGPDLKTILDIINTTTRFYPFTYKDYDGNHSVTVYSGSLSQKQFRTDGNWVWESTTFALIQK